MYSQQWRYGIQFGRQPLNEIDAGDPTNSKNQQATQLNQTAMSKKGLASSDVPKASTTIQKGAASNIPAKMLAILYDCCSNLLLWRPFQANSVNSAGQGRAEANLQKDRRGYEAIRSEATWYYRGSIRQVQGFNRQSFLKACQEKLEVNTEGRCAGKYSIYRNYSNQSYNYSNNSRNQSSRYHSNRYEHSNRYDENWSKYSNNHFSCSGQRQEQSNNCNNSYNNHHNYSNSSPVHQPGSTDIRRQQCKQKEQKDKGQAGRVAAQDRLLNIIRQQQIEESVKQQFIEESDTQLYDRDKLKAELTQTQPKAELTQNQPKAEVKQVQNKSEVKQVQSKSSKPRQPGDPCTNDATNTLLDRLWLIDFNTLHNLPQPDFDFSLLNRATTPDLIKLDAFGQTRAEMFRMIISQPKMDGHGCLPLNLYQIVEQLLH